MINPAIILMIPQMGENIGAAARAMANFGLSDLRLVAPRDGWPNEKAEAMAAGAIPDYVQVSVFDTLEEAIADIQYLLATSARRRDMNKPVFTSREAAVELSKRAAEAAKTAILFGRERNGLENDEIAKAQGIIHVPTSPDFASINLAQTVLLMAYEIFQNVIATSAQAGGSNPLNTSESLDRAAAARDDEKKLATQKDMTEFLARLEVELEKGGFFRSEGLRPTMVRNITNMFTRAELTRQEVNTLQGIVSALRESRG